MSAAADKSSILIVDDMEANLVALQAVLSSLDQNLVTARSGEEALKAMLREEFAVVLLDVSMPGMDGFETAANIKRLDQTKDVPVILLTGADAESDYVYRGYAVGAADFLTKPIDPWLLRTKVNIFLELHRKNVQLAAQADQLRRLLVGEGKPVPPEAVTGTGAKPPSAAVATPSGRPPSAGSGAGETRAVTEISEQLAQIELQLREAKGDEATALADRVAALERAIDRLKAPDGT
ncbi:response regulator [Streptomyces meridianus]|uniref:Response regulator n=1 Tax=Streptomyces meridianus TaxID=2938945 RepID=A0ABT0X580_9ACTN|nr:response regulator [Streptomyces meridianus]MCM2577068.1 response regulator [Streptomyces meridianus]